MGSNQSRIIYNNALLAQDRWDDPAAEYALPRDAGKTGILPLKTQCNSTAETRIPLQILKADEDCNNRPTLRCKHWIASAMHSSSAMSCNHGGDADTYESEGQGRVKRFLPFSLGTRDCVGQSLARMNATTTVAMLLARFKFQLADKVSAKRAAAMLVVENRHGLYT